MKKIRSLLKKLQYLPWTLRINFHYFSFKVAVRLPIHCLCRVVFNKIKGTVSIKGPISSGMIILGGKTICDSEREPFFWQVEGDVVFHGPCFFTDKIFFNCNSGSVLKFGSKCSFVRGTKIICSKEIIFGNKIRSSWDCTYIDTDFHPLIDIVRNKPLKQCDSIQISDGCWIGHNSIISKGAKLPRNTTVSSGSVVKNKFKQENCIIAGNIASVVDEGYVRDDCLDS
ncbi:hypothetical protein [Fibrobacter sp.]